MTDPISQQQLITAGGADKTYVDDVFSTYLYNGTNNAISINNGLDLATEGGLVWLKTRNTTYSNFLFDTERGGTKQILSNANNAENTELYGVNVWNTNGYGVGANGISDGGYNSSSNEYASWSFRRCPGFFDIVTYTGNGVSGRQIAHNLGSVPGFMLVKCLSSAESWAGWHRTMPNTTDAGGWSININTSNAGGGNGGVWNSTNPTATHFTVGNDGQTNSDGATYVAYIWAHDEQSFGEGGDQSIIKCGSYEGNGSTNGPVINLGWEPQFVIIKQYSDNGQDWRLLDSMRGIVSDSGAVNGLDAQLYPSDNAAENNSEDRLELTATTFQLTSSNADTNAFGDDYIYIAIRRPDGYVGKPALAGTDVFAMATGNSSATIPNFTSNFPVDYGTYRETSGSAGFENGYRLLQHQYNYLNVANALASWDKMSFDSNIGWQNHSGHGAERQSWMWKRGQGFDVSCYKGSGTADYVYHSLGQIPEMIWVKGRENATVWVVGHKGLNGGTEPWDYHARLDSNNAAADNSGMWNDTAPELNRFTIGTDTDVGGNGVQYLSLLFASVPGISKVGYFTGDASANREITVGFSPRFLFYKRTDAGGAGENWGTFDTLRGWTSGSGNAKILYLNQLTAQANTNYCYPTSTGFVIVEAAAINSNNGEYIYYAHA